MTIVHFNSLHLVLYGLTFKSTTYKATRPGNAFTLKREQIILVLQPYPFPQLLSAFPPACMCVCFVWFR